VVFITHSTLFWDSITIVSQRQFAFIFFPFIFYQISYHIQSLFTVSSKNILQERVY